MVNKIVFVKNNSYELLNYNLRNEIKLKGKTMVSKRVLVLGIALILMTLVVGLVFAGEYKGVVWEYSGGETIIGNFNDYAVTVGAKNDDNGDYQRFRLNPRANKRLEGRYTVTAVHSL